LTIRDSLLYNFPYWLIINFPKGLYNYKKQGKSLQLWRAYQKNDNFDKGVKMAKGYELKKTKADSLLEALYSENPTRIARDVHKEVFARLRDRKDPYYEPYIEDDNWPRENTVAKHWKDLRDKDKARLPESKELDNPWCMGTLNRHPISPEAIPAVLEVWKFRVAQEKNFTIREAKWAAWLSVSISKISPSSADNHNHSPLADVSHLSDMASIYANIEFIYELSGHSITNSNFDSTPIDKLYMGIPPSIEIILEEEKQQQGLVFEREVLKGSPAYKKGLLKVSGEKIEGYRNTFLAMNKAWEIYQKEVQDEGKHTEKRQE
jgi:hypothetical protein